MRRSAGTMQGLEFEQQLVDDGAGGLCTRHRVSPYIMAQAGMPIQVLPSGDYPIQLSQQPGTPISFPRFATTELKNRAIKIT